MKYDKYASHIRTFPIDTEKIGPLLTRGKQHLVFAYGKEQVIKIPRRDWYNNLYGVMHYKIVSKDIAFLKKHLSPFILPTEILLNAHQDYMLVQKRVHKMTYLSTSSLELVYEQLADFIEKGRKMAQKDSLYIDYFGYLGTIYSLLALLQRDKTRAFMTNIVVSFDSPEPKLFLVDTNLSAIDRSIHPMNIFHQIVDKGTIYVSKKLAHWAFNLDI